MKRIYLLLACLVIFAVAADARAAIADIIREYNAPASKKVLVVAHRADWRNFPENSLAAIRSSITLGVDIIEIDVCRTKDGVLVLMHDDTIDRTTTGKGLVSDLTWAELSTFYLRDGLGSRTRHKIPTLEEALLAVKGRAMINLDRCYRFLPEAMVLLEKTGTVDHAIFKSDLPLAIVQAENGSYLPQVAFMPIVRLDLPGADTILRDYLMIQRPAAVQVNFAQERPFVVQTLAEIRNAKVRIWVNSLWPHMNAGHDDELAVDDPEAAYGWLLAQGVTIIQTDRPALLISYLEKHGRR